MLNCRQITRLVSQSLDRKLPWYQRLAVRFHLLYCVWCRRYANQVLFLRKATKALAAEEASAARLSTEAKEQMCQRMEQALKNSPPPPP